MDRGAGESRCVHAPHPNPAAARRDCGKLPQDKLSMAVLDGGIPPSPFPANGRRAIASRRRKRRRGLPLQCTPAVTAACSPPPARHRCRKRLRAA
ncbi:hypothetical protein [Lysobacter gummosus]|uniref:hypothetical protein n=1 Tax=Lysobacter gummosus TaxID=262324 RepID=UPI00362E6103